VSAGARKEVRLLAVGLGGLFGDLFGFGDDLGLGGLLGLDLGLDDGLGLSGDLGRLLVLLRLEDRLLLVVGDERDLLVGGLHGRDGVLVTLELAPVAGELEEHEHLLGRLGADAEPVLRAVGVDLDARGLLGRVVQTDLLDDAAVALGARVGDDDAVVRSADLAEALQTDFDSHNSPVLTSGTRGVPVDSLSN